MDSTLWPMRKTIVPGIWRVGRYPYLPMWFQERMEWFDDFSEPDFFRHLGEPVA